MEPERFPGSRVIIFGQAVGALAMPEVSYRSLEQSCLRQASITSDPEARKALAEMARKYRDMADHEERQQKSKGVEIAN
jgi:hypothetical protein